MGYEGHQSHYGHQSYDDDGMHYPEYEYGK